MEEKQTKKYRVECGCGEILTQTGMNDMDCPKCHGLIEFSDFEEVRQYTYKFKTGRPTKLTRETLDKAWEYLERMAMPFVETETLISVSTEVEVEEGEKPKTTYTTEIGTTLERPDLPNRPRMALEMGISEKTVYLWLEANETHTDEQKDLQIEFLQCLELVDTIQKCKLMENNTKLPSVVANRILAALHGMKDRIDTTSDDKPLPSAITINADNKSALQAAGKAYDKAMDPVKD